ncbi:K(+)/H(+) antiporter subunit KhtT [compost metagenome]|uniref:Cation:proton antiporter regulatory subunit n=1 Tax=Paenibacillus rhizolycopersici TaxID=2780073 RepID=A0ABS2H331_9BACL|nr:MULTISPECIES: cation:proton antiporter regulatory subunit [Paenibacillus]MBM6995872.1 cation:proton antiporter regulatory subunit [Paenibacillus rhizolycopersici]MUG86387.1 potassium:proton antiporter [Paenibacillus timonensis]GIP49249.1 potassium transporter [Paenibacillus sp. J53TS2]
MNLKETDLPGIGKKFVIQARSGDKLTIIIHDDGRRELYHFDHDDPDDSVSMVTLDDDEARYVSAIVGGVTYKPTALENIEVALGDLIIEWYKLEPNYKAIGHTIGELKIRQRSGATIIAVIEKNHKKHINPGPDLMLTADAMVVVLGERLHQQQIRQILLNGSG